MSRARQLYVISDLHIGGVYPESPQLGERGFRICTHARELAQFVDALAAKPAGATGVELVINGDFVDFLAERRAPPAEWSPFLTQPEAAVEKLREIVVRDRPLFDALARLLARGHDLVLVLGNHDIELAIPQVRGALADVLGSDRFRFFYDGEAYVAGDALIEHGNRYDSFNVVDHDRLRRFRSLLSRRQPIPAEYAFEAPAGSRMVAEVINPIKERYKFVDLLNPYVEATIPLLLALEPGLRSKLARVIPIAAQAARHGLRENALPSVGGDISSAPAGAAGPVGGDMGGLDTTESPASISPHERRLDEALEKILGAEAKPFLAALEAEARPLDGTGGDIASGEEMLSSATGLLSLLLSGSGSLENRLPALLRAVRVLQNDRTFDRDFEPPSVYTRAAGQLAREGGFSHVVFGHTHLARDLPLPNGARYLNSGTWADLMEFPKDILSGQQDDVRDKLRQFCEDLANSQLGRYIVFKPTFVRLEVNGDGRVTRAAVLDYTGPESL
ncbi:MAG: metallophosphoesterase [Betaproteobacteria bacterium]|nr:metallophosphoesterase [Betaproteobacteria bacterium]